MEVLLSETQYNHHNTLPNVTTSHSAGRMILGKNGRLSWTAAPLKMPRHSTCLTSSSTMAAMRSSWEHRGFGSGTPYQVRRAQDGDLSVARWPQMASFKR